MQDAVIVSGARTPVGRFGGAFKDVSAPDLGAMVSSFTLINVSSRANNIH